MNETFAQTFDFHLHQQNSKQLRHVLARLTYWVDQQCGMATHFEDLISQGKGKPFEIEHIWANHYEMFSEWFGHPKEFEVARNRIGGLVLLQRGHNQSLWRIRRTRHRVRWQRARGPRSVDDFGRVLSKCQAPVAIDGI